MGNSPSTTAKSERAGSQPHSPAPASALHRDRDRARDREHNDAGHAGRREPRRRESLHSLSSVKATAAPPSTSTIVASSSQAPSRPIPTSGAPSSHTRNRSQTVATPRPNAQDTASISPRSSTMGAEQSRIGARPQSRGASLTSPAPPDEPRLSPASRPVDVPGSAAAGQPRSFHPSPLDPAATPSEAFHLPPSSFSRPPRLPLPIEEELHTPGSPIISQADITSPSPVDGAEPDEIPRRSSVVSSNLDEDEDRDGFEGYPTDTAGPKVPTVIEWRSCAPTDKVYVTGTFTNWERKFRLYKDGPSKHKDSLSALLQLPPGTHHIKFIVNGDMMTSEDLPTTVDYTNILVNYVEVSLDDLPTAENPTPAPVIPATAPASIAEPPAPSRPLDIRPRPGANIDPATHQQPRNTPPPSGLSQPRDPAPSPSPAVPAGKVEKVEKPRPTPSPKPPVAREPPKEYTSDIPAYLLDLDTWIPPAKENDQSPAHQAARYRFERASAAAESQPVPPSLPMFLSKSILNGTTPMKDDSSVLIMPNHTVLNHLATTNIKQESLYVSQGDSG
ncbi:hypothetical protein MBLNU459_g5384t1 [Dothideomycetes sp. NU459]